MKRPVVLLPLAYFVPGFKAGGPIKSIKNLVDSLGDEFDFRIICSDRDLGDQAPYGGVRVGEWLEFGSAKIFYVPGGLIKDIWLIRAMLGVHFDLLYLNSFFSLRYSLLPIILRQLGVLGRGHIVLAPRGELSAGALQIKSFKKRAYISLLKALGLHTPLVWHASTELESADIRQYVDKKAEVHVAINLPSPLPSQPPERIGRKENQPLRIVFLSRISRKKNLDYALRVLSRVSSHVSFSVYGPNEDVAYFNECRSLAEKLPSNIAVHWCGAVEPANIPAIFASNDLFFFPTRGENFGHVIAEAFAAGTAVLVSDTTPWRDLQDLGVGHDLPLSDPAAFVDVIDAAARQTESETVESRARVFTFAQERLRKSGDLDANRKLLIAAIGQSLSISSGKDQ